MEDVQPADLHIKRHAQIGRAIGRHTRAAIGTLIARSHTVAIGFHGHILGDDIVHIVQVLEIIDHLIIVVGMLMGDEKQHLPVALQIGLRKRRFTGEVVVFAAPVIKDQQRILHRRHKARMVKISYRYLSGHCVLLVSLCIQYAP